MKHQNLTHEVIFNSELRVQGSPKDGDMATYKSKVVNAYFYRYDGNDKYVKIYLDRDFILDLAKEIQEIEKHEEQEIFMNIPF